MNIEIIQKYRTLLQKGHILCVPTDTVYGLICDAFNPASIHKIYDIKQRDIKKPFSLFVASLEEAQNYAYFDKKVLSLAHAFWPGPLTLLLKRKKSALYTLEPLDNIAIRIPNHPFLLSVLPSLPLVNTSANLSGEQAVTEYADLPSALLNIVDHAICMKGCFVGKESTILDVSSSDVKIIREGALSKEALLPFLE